MPGPGRDEDGEALLEAADAWARLGDLVAAGDAAAQAADVHRRQGRQGSALSAAALAEKLAGRSGARTPALAIAARPLPLTAREREIAALAARGCLGRSGRSLGGRGALLTTSGGLLGEIGAVFEGQSQRPASPRLDA